MDPFNDFMHNFERNVKKRDSNNLTEILKNRKCFQNIAKNESELVLSILFKPDEGLHTFLNNELERSAAQKGFDTAIKEAFYLLKFVLEQFTDAFEPYIKSTKETCELALKTRCSSLVQKAACNTFIRLIELYKRFNLGLNKTIKGFVDSFHRLTIKERSLQLLVLSAIAKHVPEVPEIQEYSSTIVRYLRNDFKKEYNPQRMKQSMDIFQVYFDVLSDILKVLSNEERTRHSKEFYMWIKELSSPNKYGAKKVSMRSAINLLSNNMDLFHEFVYGDHQFWHNYLIVLSQDKNDDCRSCGQRALKVFFCTMGNILSYKTSDFDKNILLHYKNLFEDQLKKNEQVDSNILRFVIHGYSQLAAPCKKHLDDSDVRDMFFLIVQCSMPLCFREDLEKQTDLQNIYDYQEALSEIIVHTSNLSIDEINIILKLSILSIKRFPDLSITSQSSAIASLINTIINIGITSKSLLEEYLYNLIQNGVIWTCSHTLLIDAELQRGLKNLEDLPLCYKNYLPLWMQLLKPNRYRKHTQTAQEVVDSMMHTCIVLISRLNLNTKRKEDSVFSDAAFSQIAENEDDFRIFVNIVGFYVDIINKLESSVLVNTIQKFLLKIISMSYKHPLISGFYKLVHATFKHVSNLIEEEIKMEISELLIKYLLNLLNMISTFSGELLTTCLYLILDMPKVYMKIILRSTLPAFKIAFTIGLSNFEVADRALSALEQWTSYLNGEPINEFLQEIVHLLEPYLHGGESSVEFLQDIIKTERKVIKRIVLVDDENTLEKFQTRVLLFIATLDTDIVMEFVYKRSMNTGGTWDKKDLLKYSLVFPDTIVDIHFDKILPRLLLLAQNSGDRRTKIIACEALHAMVSFVLGKTPSNSDRFVPIYTMLCPALLNLGCDYDEAAKKIFQPLMLQLTHWLSSKFMIKSPATTYFIDSFFNGLSNDSNSSLREFSGMCLAEFIYWSAKQSNNDRETRVNSEEVISKMTNFALHPSTSKRVAAAIAFNHLYKRLREDEEIVSVYWLEILYCFVKSLDGCNDPSILTALDHVERVVMKDDISELLNKKYHNRKQPHEFEGVTLTHAVYWLFTQCGSLDQHCRAKCMELVTKFSVKTDCYEVKTVINNYIDFHGIEKLKLIILGDSKFKIEGLSCDSMLPLLRSFDCFIWLIRNEFLGADFLISNVNSDKHVIFNHATNFIHLINNTKRNKEEDVILLSKELEYVQTLQCKVITTMFDFLQILIEIDERFVPDFLFNKDFSELISKCIMCPESVGFDTKNLELSEELPSIMGKLLQSIIERNNVSLLNSIKQELSVYVEKYKNNFIDFESIVNGTDTYNDLKQYVQGLLFLEQHNILNQLNNVSQLFEQSANHITQIFKVLAVERIGELVCRNIKSSAKDYLQIVMKLLLMRYEPSTTRTLIQLIENNTMLGPDYTKIEHGIHFLNVFKNEIFNYMLKDVDNTMEVFNDLFQLNSSVLLIIMEQLFLFVQRHKKEFHECIEVLVDTVVKKFVIFERAVNNFHDRKQKMISIYGIAVHLKKEPTKLLPLSEDFYTWILNQLWEASDIEYKIQILRNFLVCLTDVTNIRRELLVILNSLRNDRLTVSSSDFLQQNVKALKIVHCFQTLLTLLPVTKSVVVFETIVSFAAGVAEHLCDKKTEEYLEKYFNLIDDECTVASIDKAYKLFMNWSRPTNERMDILRRFLLPIFEFCKTTAIEQFFEENIREIYTIINRSLTGTSSDIKQLILSKIGCYDLISIMFAKIHIDKIDNTESTITQNAIDDVKEGNELYKNLYKSAVDVRMLKTSDPEHRELMRLLHCSAYNCSIAIVCMKEDQGSYVTVFGENRKTEQFIWENIVDCQKRYDFQQMFKEYPKHCKKVINIRKSKRERQTSAKYSYMYSYDLSTCTLQEDLNAYDFNEAVITNTPQNNRKEESMSLIFESDDLNNHECMGSICGVLKHLITTEISVPPISNDADAPQWLKCFCTSIAMAKHNNIRLFMFKVVLNMQTVFKPYAKLLLQPVMYAATLYLRTSDLNYIIVDIIEMLIEWQIVPEQSKDKELAQQLWEAIIHKALVKKTSGISKTIHKYNRNIVKTLLEMWKTCLKLPERRLKDKMATAPGAAVYLILICFVNGMQSEIVGNNAIMEFLEKSLENWKDDEETIMQCCECFGLIFKFLDENQSQANKKCAIIDSIRRILIQMQGKFEKRQIKCIWALCKNYLYAATIYIELVAASIFKVDMEAKAYCLEIFLLCIPNITPDEIRKRLNDMQFQDLVKNKNPPCEKVSLRITNSLVPVLPPSYLVTLVNLISSYTKHDSSEYREIAYDVFINIHKKYAADIADDESILELNQISKEVLLSGILDPDEQLQEKILNFWTQNTELASTCRDRLLEILSIYTPTVGNNFLPFMLLATLDLTKKSKKYMEKMFEPLHDCSYTEYQIELLPWRTRHLESSTPLFAPSQARRISETLTQMSGTMPSMSDFSYARQSRSSGGGLKLRATQELNFDPTYDDDEYAVTSDNEEYEDVEYDDEFKVPQVPQPAYNRKSKRFLTVSETSTAMRNKEIKANIQRANMIKEEASRQRNTVKLYRKYRTGDFPDIEITPATLIESLQQLAKKDPLICKDLTVSIVCSLLENSKQKNFVEKVASSLKHIVEDQQGTDSGVGAILEILLNTRIANCSPEIVAKVSKSNNLNFHGSLILEEDLMYNTDDFEPPAQKKSRNNEVSVVSNKWLQLTSLYESMNDVDVVLSIFQHHITHENMQEAAFAQAANDWVKAKAAYEGAYETESDVVKEYCLQGLFECLSHLCNWKEIDKRVQERLNDDVSNIWNDPWKDWLFSWMMETYARKIQEETIEKRDCKKIADMNHWLKDDAKVKHIKRLFGTEISTIFMEGKQIEVAREFLLNSLDEIREQWVKIHPLSTQLRIEKLQKLRLINDVNEYLKILKKTKCEIYDFDEVVKLCSKSSPSKQDAIIPWDKLITHRIYFLNHLHELKSKKEDSQNIPDTEETEAIFQLQPCKFKMRLKMIEAALNQRNKYIANNHLEQLKEDKDNYAPDLKHRFFIASARTEYLNAEIETDMEIKLANIVSSWRYCHELLEDNDINPAINVNVRQQISKLATKIVQLSVEDTSFSNLLTENCTSFEEINAESNDPFVMKNALEVYSLNHLKTCCDIAGSKDVKECYFILSQYCYDKLSRNENDVQISREFVNSTLKAMSNGSLEAAHYFPCLLKPEYFQDEETKKIFLNESVKVQTWLFLSWQAQLFSHLGTSIAPLIIPILKRIIETYPNAVIYTYSLTMELNPALLKEAGLICNRPDIDRFLLAMQYVSQPELYLLHYLSEFVKNLSLGAATAVDIIMKKVYLGARENRDDPKPGGIFRVIEVYKSKLRELARKQPDKIKQQVADMIQKLKDSLDKRKDGLKLKEYSPWLHDFAERDIEVPGQYTGNRKPMPQYHARIIRLEPTVKVMQSLRKPIRVTMVGNDAKEYDFLVKFGEDLRQDQRLQQLFNIMNKTLCNDAVCKQRQLSLDTYQVIPMSRTVGLIQWVGKTRCLQELMYYTLPEKEVKKYDNIPKDYATWIKNAAPSKRVYEAYKEATVKYKASRVIGKMNEFINKTKWDCLRNTFKIISPSVESFVTMRRNFISSYATMCVAHWTLGIGDRHLGNTLIAIDSGRCLGIDFGLAFDAGIDQKVPELMPFRLTNQILGLLKPFTEKDLLGATMIRVLRALRNEQGPILSCMDVFVHEPLNWTEHVNKALKESEEDIKDIKWVPMKKIEAVKKKLNGMKPSLITLHQLKEQHNDKYYDRYYNIVLGDDDIKQARAKIEDKDLTPEKQVECLLDQATDLNILGRTYVGWRPWL